MGSGCGPCPQGPPRRGLKFSLGEERPFRTEAPKQRVLVAALVLPGNAADQANDPLEEITGLAEAAGAEVVGGVVQKRATVQPKFAFGKGKVEELALLCKEQCAEVLAVDLDLSPSQGRNLEKALDVRILDRSELILDIFATRARTRQAKLQVELAQMEYLRPRLMRMWTHLERTEGAIGARGPGETQLETDRRLVSQRINTLKRKLKEIENHSKRSTDSRESALSMSLVGYTNAGKSSLMRRLTGADVYIADQLFATLDTRVRRWILQDRRAIVLSDTVGFVRDLPHHLVASFHATLEETLQADVLIHVCDASALDLNLQIQAVESVLQSLGAAERDSFMVLNKLDLLSEEDRSRILAEYPDALPISVLSGEGVQEFEQVVADMVDSWSLRLDVQVPAAAGALLATFQRSVKYTQVHWEGEMWCAQVTMLPREWNPLRHELEQCGGRWAAVESPRAS